MQREYLLRNQENLIKTLKDYEEKANILKPFRHFGIGCPLRLRINVYKGCGYQCQFCYVINKSDEPREFSRQIGRYLEEDIKLAKKYELDTLPVMLSCSTDPLQPLEEKKGYTKEVLEILVKNNFSIIIMTQNPALLLREEYLNIIKNASTVVEVSIPSLSSTGIFKSGAPSPHKKFKALSKLVEENIPVRLRLDPIVPFPGELGQSKEEIEEIIEEYKKLYSQARDEIKEEMMIIANVMVLTEDLLNKKLTKWDSEITQKLRNYYEKNGFEYEREDGIKMYVLNSEIQEELFKPIFDKCKNHNIPLCPCVADVYFCNTYTCEFPQKNIPLSIENSSKEKFKEKVKETFHYGSSECSNYPIKKFIETYFEFFVSLSEKVFTSNEFKKYLKEKNLKEFFSKKDFIKELLTEILGIEGEELDVFSPYPVLYWIFATLVETIGSCSRDGVKPDVIWGSFNFWDSLTYSHYGTQFLHSDYFKPGEKIIFDKIVNKWLLVKRIHILTITELFLTHKSNRKIIVIQKQQDEPPRLDRYKKEGIVITLDNSYNDISKTLRDKWMIKIKNRISRGEDVNKVMEEYINSIPFKELSKVVENLRNSLKTDLDLEKNEEEIQKFLTLLLILDLVSPKKWRWIMICPALVYSGEPVGGVFLVLHELLDFSVCKFFQYIFSEAISIPQILIDKQKFLEKSLRSAIAAIMSRNMSHNIGSHVLINLEKNEITEEDLRYFMRYLRLRMDFLAQISTEWAKWSLPTRFMQDLIYEFLNQYCLLKYIGSSESLEIGRLKFIIYIDDQRFGPIGSKELEEKMRSLLYEHEKLVAIPGAITGRQAFFVILENFIRNVAKHSYIYKSKDEDLEIYIKLNTQDYSIEIWNHISDIEIKGKDTLHEKINKEYVEPPIISSTGEPIKGGWGIAEMKISSCFLQKKGIEILGEEIFSKEIFQAGEYNKNGKSFLKYKLKLLRLQEIGIFDFKDFCKDKDREKHCIFIHSNLTVDSFLGEEKDYDYEFGVILPPEEEKEKLLGLLSNNGWRLLERLPVRLFWVGDENDFENYSEIRKRFVLLNDDEFIEQWKQKEIDDFKLWLYTKWIEHIQEVLRKEGNTKLLLLLKVKKANVEASGEEEKEKGKKKLYISKYIEDNYPYLIPKVKEHSEGKIVINDKIIFYKLPLQDLKDIQQDIERCPSMWFIRHKFSALSDDEKDYLYRKANNRIYYEEFSGADPHFGLLSLLPKDEYQKKKLILSLAECGLFRIAIVDERIGNRFGEDFFYYKKKSKIFLISEIRKEDSDKDSDKTINICKDGLSIQIGKNGDIKILNKEGNKEEKVDIIIFHQGILEKGLNKEVGIWEDQEKLEEWISNIKKEIPFVFVTSGRGKPGDVPRNVKFVSFSDIESACVSDMISKLILNLILMNVK